MDLILKGESIAIVRQIVHYTLARQNCNVTSTSESSLSALIRYIRLYICFWQQHKNDIDMSALALRFPPSPLYIVYCWIGDP